MIFKRHRPSELFISLYLAYHLVSARKLIVRKMNSFMTIVLVFVFGLVAVHAGFTGYGFANAGFQPGGGISNGARGYGASYNTYGTNVYYGGGVGGGYGYHG